MEPRRAPPAPGAPRQVSRRWRSGRCATRQATSARRPSTCVARRRRPVLPGWGAGRAGGPAPSCSDLSTAPRQFRLHRPVDVAVDVVGADPVDDAVGLAAPRSTCGLTPRQPQRDAVGLRSSCSSVSFAAPWESTKLTPSRSSTSARGGRRPSASSRTRSSSASAVAKNRPPSRRSTAMPGNVSSRGVLVEVAEHLGPGLAAEQRHRRPRRDVDEPAERERRPRSRRRRGRPPRARRRSPPPRPRSRIA